MTALYYPICCGLDCLSTILKFLQDYVNKVAERFPYFHKFQSRYHPFSLYTIIFFNHPNYQWSLQHSVLSLYSPFILCNTRWIYSHTFMGVVPRNIFARYCPYTLLVSVCYSYLGFPPILYAMRIRLNHTRFY